jgi:hypothetical protein
MPENAPSDILQTPAKKAYAKPSLIEYGSIAKLTQGGPSVGGDAPAKQAACL